MSIRYYPKSKIKPNKYTPGGQFSLGDKPYIGKYYETFDGQYFTGINPVYGKNEKLSPIPVYHYSPYINVSEFNLKQREQLATATRLKQINPATNTTLNQAIANKDSPTSYFPYPLESDYAIGSITRYFTKRINTPGYVIEISQDEYAAISNGSVSYDVTFWQLQQILWKLTGPLNQKRISQYDTRAGIIDTNKRLVETADKSFLGIKDYIAEEYSKWARPTE
jgi:hypothetical protein